VSSIYIFDGHTGKSITIIDRNDIEHIIENLNSITLRKDKWSLFYMGFGFRTTIFKKDGGVYKKIKNPYLHSGYNSSLNTLI